MIIPNGLCRYTHLRLARLTPRLSCSSADGLRLCGPQAVSDGRLHLPGHARGGRLCGRWVGPGLHLTSGWVRSGLQLSRQASRAVCVKGGSSRFGWMNSL